MVEFVQVDKSFGAQDILRGATFRINPGEHVGVVGPNGAGKSTVFELIAGEISPDRGRVNVPVGIRMGYVHQDLSFDQIDTPLVEYTENAVPDLRRIEQSVHDLQHRFAENTVTDRDAALRELGELQTRFETLGGYHVRSQAEVALGGLGFRKDDFARPLREFSGGWQMRAELARVIVSDPALLLLDEPSNYLDIPAIEWLQRFLRDFRGTLLMISHDRYLLNTLTTATLEIAHTEATRYAGNYDLYASERELRVRQRESAQKNQDRRREQIERFIERFRAKNTKATQVQSKVKMLERMEEIAIPRRIVSPGRIRVPTPPHCGAEIIRLENAGLTYDGRNWVLRGVNLAIGRGDKTALVGLNGTGKTSLLRIVAGKLPPGEGRRVLGHKVIVGYQSQEFTDTMNPRDTALQTVKLAAPGATEQDVRRMLGSFGFSGEAVEKPVEVLSGGEKVRVAFARLLINPPNFLVLDEPTTHLDIAAREALEEALQSYAGTLCLVSHDIAFVRKVATSIIAMEPPAIRVYCGDYDYYREKKESAAPAAPSPGKGEAQAPKSKQESRRERAAKVQERARQRRPLLDRVAKAETTVMKLEAEQTELANQLSDPHVRGYADLSRRLAHVAEDLESATAAWESAAEALQILDRETE